MYSGPKPLRTPLEGLTLAASRTNLVRKEVNVLIRQDEQAVLLHKLANRIIDLATERPWEKNVTSNAAIQSRPNALTHTTASRIFPSPSTKEPMELSHLKDVIAGVHPGDIRGEPLAGQQAVTFHDLVRITSQFSQTLQGQRTDNRVLASLHFAEIRERQADVASAHQNTLD